MVFFIVTGLWIDEIKEEISLSLLYFYTRRLFKEARGQQVASLKFSPIIKFS